MASDRRTSEGARRLREELARQVQQGTLRAGARIPSYRDLARKYGITLASVQRAVTALERQGYLRASHGRGTFVSGVQAHGAKAEQSRVIAISFPFHIYPPEMMQAVQSRAMERGFLASPWFTEPFSQDLASEAQLVKKAIEERLHGVMLLTSPFQPTNAPVFEQARRAGVRVVHLAQYRPDMSGDDFVLPDFRRSGIAGATHLLLGGYRTFVSIFQEDDFSHYARQLRRGFEETLLDQGVSRDRVLRLRWDPSLPWLDAIEPGTGFYVDYDTKAEPIVKALRERGRRVPEDFGMIYGVGSIEDRREPRVSCVRFRQAAQLAAALDYLMADPRERESCREEIGPEDIVVVRTTKGPWVRGQGSGGTEAP